MGLLKCVKLHLRAIAGAWTRQFILIDKGWSNINKVGLKLQMPSAFINVLRNSSSVSSVNGQFDEFEYKNGVSRFFSMMLRAHSLPEQPD